MINMIQALSKAASTSSSMSQLPNPCGRGDALAIKIPTEKVSVNAN